MRKSLGYPKNHNSTISFSGGLHNDQEIILIDTFDILDFRSLYDPPRPYELVSTGYPVEDQWEGWQPEPQASTSQALPFINDTSQELVSINLITFPYFLDSPKM